MSRKKNIAENEVVIDESFIMGDELIEEEKVDENIVSVEIEGVDFGDYSIEDYEEAPITYNRSTDVVEVDDIVFDSLVDDEGFIEVPTGVVTKEGKKETKKVKAVKVKKRKRRKNFTIGLMYDENFGALLPYIQDVNVTDNNWNGKQLWIDDVLKGRYCSEIVLDNDFVTGFAIRVSNVVSKTFNKYQPRLEAETDELRITVLHDSISHTGTAISIRKTPAVKRINFAKSIREGSYCPEQVANLLSNSVKAKMNVVICGLPGVGKTELVKFLTNYIFPNDRVITIEDTLEIHYSDINPNKDCLELRVENTFSYTDAIKASLRLLPQWILLSEARSTEVQYLLESVSTGAKCITTLHTDDVRKIPERVVNMLGEISSVDNILNTVYNFFDLGILIDKIQDEETGNVKRFIAQVCLFSRESGDNECIMLYDNGELTDNAIPEEHIKRYNRVGIYNPYEYTFIKG